MRTLFLICVSFVLLFPGNLMADESGPLFNSLKGDLVKSTGKRLAKFDESVLSEVQYYGIYYSASWCGPCRQFTPDLVKWYNGTKHQNPQFELIFVSSDQTEADMASYMEEDKMEWPALDFSKKRTNRELTKYSGSGIPSLVLVNRSGEVLSDSYVNGTYVGPRKVLKDIDDTLKANPASPEAVAAAEAASPASAKTGSTVASGSSFDEFFKKK